MSVLKKLAGQTAVYGLSSIVGRFLNYLLAALHTRVFVGDVGQAEYGISAYFFAFASFGAVLFTYGMETAFFRFSEKKESKDTVFATILWSLLVSSIVFAGLLILFAEPITDALNQKGRGLYLQIFAVILGADAISTILFARLRQQNKAFRFASIRLFSIGINIFLNLLFYLFLPKTAQNASVLWMFLANMIASLAVLPFFIGDLRLLRLGFDKALMREMLIYAFPLIFMGFAGMINETLDRMLLKFLIADPFVADRETGIYSANYKLSIIITLFIQAFRFAAEPFFFSRAKDKDVRETQAIVMQYFMLVCATIFLMIVLYLDIFKYFIGKSYWSGLKVVPILLLANVCLGAYYNLSFWYKLTDKTKLGAFVSLGGACITLIINILLIPSMSYVGSAWATLTCYFSMTVVSYFLGQKYYPVAYPVGRIGFYIGFALLLYFIFDYIKANFAPPSVSLSFLLSSVFFILYLGVIFILEKKKIKIGN